MQEDIVKAKATWRQVARASLSRLTPEELSARSQRVCEAVRHDAAWNRAQVVALFAALPSEVDLSALWNERGDRQFCYPRVEGEEMHFYLVEKPEDLKPTNWKVAEPQEHAQPVLPSKIDMILLPGLAFGRDGSRLGRGGGYYDRLLSKPEVKAERVGICYGPQLFDSLPREPHDQCVDRVLCDVG